MYAIRNSLICMQNVCQKMITHCHSGRLDELKCTTFSFDPISFRTHPITLHHYHRHLFHCCPINYRKLFLFIYSIVSGIANVWACVRVRADAELLIYVIHHLVHKLEILMSHHLQLLSEYNNTAYMNARFANDMLYAIELYCFYSK